MEISRSAEKKQIRNQVKAARKAMTAGQQRLWDEQLFSCLCQVPEVRDAATVYCYLSCHGETDTLRFIQYLWSRQTSVAVPKVFGRGKMVFYQIHSMEDLIPGCMGILEPELHCFAAAEKNAPVITPGLAFDQSGNRIGYGGGYYDRFFEQEPEHVRIGLAFPYQIYETLPAEGCDRKLDQLLVAGEGRTKIYEFNRNR